MKLDESMGSDGDETGAAFASVLRAEQEANAAIDHCREQARVIVTETEAKARAVLERADRRLSRLREKIRSDLACTLAAIDAEGEETGSIEVPSEQLDRAVAKLIRELTSGRE